MPLSSVAFLGLLIVGVVALGLLGLGLAARMPARIAFRNVRADLGRTVLLVLGLLVGTTIISGSLVINDTVGALNVHYALVNFGLTDEGIFNQSAVGDYQPFSYSVYINLSTSVAGNRWIAGVTPEVRGVTQAYDHRNGVPETNLDLVGGDANLSGALGAFTTDSGASLAGPGNGQLLLDDQAATQLGAQVGDTITLYGSAGPPLNLTVQAMVKDDGRGGVFYLYLGEAGNVFVNLPAAQQLLGIGSQINFLAVTNPGSQLEGAANSANASTALNASLLAIGAPPTLTVHSLLREAIDNAVTSGQSTATIFLVFGLFSIIAGAVLVVTIFVMLSEERKGEMGTLRAIGLRRGQLILIYLFEGVVYSAGSAVAGMLLGVGVGYGMAWAFAQIFGTDQISSQSILQSFTFTTSSLVTAFAIGFLLTLITVAVATWRVSRLDIVRAIRSIPEPPPTAREYTRIAFIGAPMALLGLVLFLEFYQGSTDASYANIGVWLLILGAALVAARFFRNRIVFSTAGALLLIWAGAGPLRDAIMGSEHTGSLFLILILGIMLVLGAILVYVFNATYLVDGLIRLFGGSPRRVAIANTGLAYPGRRPVRPALTLSIFTLVVFVVVVVAGYGASLEADIEQNISAQTGGYSFFAQSTRPVPQLAAEIHNNSTLAPEISQVVPLIGGGAFLVYQGVTANDDFGYPIYSAVAGVPYGADFYNGNQFAFQSSANGSSERATWTRLSTDPTAVVVDGNFAGSNFGPSTPALAVGERLTVVNPLTGSVSALTVIGVMKGALLPGIWLNPSTARSLGFTEVLNALLTVAPGASEVTASQDLKKAFFPDGLVIYDFAQILGTSINSFQAILSLLEIFAALGLAVGIAAMGIIALRAVTERRREIGMSRASGFKRSDVFLSFLLEYSFIALLGIGLGVVLAQLLDFEATRVPSNGLVYTVPWVPILLIVTISYALTVLAVSGPALRAARMPPSEAIRYVE